MALGDVNDQYARLRGYLPSSWFGDLSPLLDALLRGFATVGVYIFQMITYLRLQTRIMTATDGWLDLIAADFFGSALKRQYAEADNSYRKRILIDLFQERATRKGMIQVLTELTGTPPSIYEPEHLQDTGAYNSPHFAFNTAGALGDSALPYQCFITVYRPNNTGFPFIAGYNISTGAFNVPSQAELISLAELGGGVTDEMIYDVIDKTKVAGTICWVNINNSQTFVNNQNGSVVSPETLTATQFNGAFLLFGGQILTIN